MTRLPYGEIKRRLIEACGKPEGANIHELCAITDNREPGVIYSLMSIYTKSGEVVKAGVRPWMRYFTSKEHAKVYEDVTLPVIKAKHKAEVLARKKAYAAAYSKRKCAEAREAKGLPPWVPGAKNPRSPEPKAKQEPVIRQTKEYKPPNITPARIVWPNHVKVQRIPHGEDTRFRFEPPEGWTGQITADWHERMKEAA